MERTSASVERQARRGGAHARVAVLAGDATFTPIAFCADDNQFLQQRELSARGRWRGSSGSRRGRSTRRPATRLTYANVLRAEPRICRPTSLRPWLVRIERAFTNDSDLCPGNTYSPVRARRAAAGRRRHPLRDL